MILGPNGQPIETRPARPVKQVRAKFDVAQTTDENYRHWAMADGLSADSAASPGVREKMRNRSRYEVANNSYARGIVNTLANDCIGTGPRLQLTGPDVNRDDAREVERRFHEWADQINLPQKLRTLRMANCVDGEGFGVIINNRKIDGVQLDIRLIEAEQVSSPSMLNSPDDADGIRYDSAGNPVVYQTLRHHPGSTAPISALWEYDPIPAESMIHLYTPERPGQRRGIPEITAALPLFAMLRRWTLATVAAAETAADFAAILYADAPAGEDAIEKADAFERIEIERRAMMTAPYGYKMSQMKAEHPTSTYDATANALINEIARCLDMPFNVAACNSSDYNYSSGRLDHQVYDRRIGTDRQRVKISALTTLFDQWRREAALIPGYLPRSMRLPGADWSHRWMWPDRLDADPVKKESANSQALKNNTTTLAEIYAKQGKDWEDELMQRSRELQRQRELNLLEELDLPSPSGS